MIAPPSEEAQPQAADVDDMIRAALARISVKDAVAEVVAATGLKRRDVYQRVLELAKERDEAVLNLPPRPNARSRSSSACRRRAAPPPCCLPRAFGSPRGAGAPRPARSISSHGAANLLIFVEVKARARLDDAAYSVTERQQRRVAAAASAWLAANPDDAMSDMRFDAILVAPRSLPRHIAGAFEAE